MPPAPARGLKRPPMNCTNCRYELSQCLDGRLPSGRRAVVMEHAENCPSCGHFWRELQAAQQLTLRLSPIPVGSDFRERLWDRVRAGEGTPEAVFHEPVSWATKLRYTMSGAAAAAVVLLGVTMLRTGRKPVAAPAGQLVASDSAGTFAAEPGPQAPAPVTAPAAQTIVLASNPLVSATQPLTFNLVAVEAAKQLEQRHAAVGTALRRLADPNSNRDAAIRQVFDNAEEFRAFGELLLDLRDRRRLFFTDPEVDADLRFAVNMLGQSRAQDRSLRTIENSVEPAMLRPRLADVSRTITLAPTDPREEFDALLRLNRQRPEVIPKLFFVLGNDDEIGRELSMLRHGMAFLMPDSCGPSWVAPRSEVEARDGLLRALKRQVEQVGDIQLEFQLRNPDTR